MVGFLANPRSVQTIQNDISTLDAEYNNLTEMMGKGEGSKFDSKLLVRTLFYSPS